MRVMFTIFVIVSLSANACGQFHTLVGWTARDPLVPKQGEFLCSGGPPGLYCKAGLESYFNCGTNGSQVEVACQEGTRCSCSVGLRCDPAITEPCQPFTLPPILPHEISTVSYGTLRVFAPFTDITYKFQKLQYQASKPGQTMTRGERQDTKWTDRAGTKHSVSTQNSYVPEGSNNQFTRYVATLHKDGDTCVSTTPGVNDMPVLQIPPEAEPDGYEMILNEKAHRWVLKNSGQHSFTPSSIEYFYYVNDETRQILRPVRYFARFSFGPIAKTSLTVNETFGLFYAQLVQSMEIYARKPRSC